MAILSQGFFLLRRPQLPLDVFYDFNTRVNNQPELFEHEIIRFFSQPAILEAIYVASPELYDSFTGLLEGRVKTGIDKLLKTLYKYLVRMTSRSTPYGLFAGCTMGQLGDQTSIVFNDNEPYYTHARLDMNYVAEMTTGLLKKSNIRSQLKFFINTSLYRIGDTYRYVESFLKNKKRMYILASVEASMYIDMVLSVARQGASINELASCIISGDISREEAEEYVNAIIDAQILVSELEATVSGEEFFHTIIGKLEGLQGTDDDVFQLKKIAGLLQSQERGISKYKDVESVIASHFVTTGSKDLIQTDLFYKTKSCTLNEQVISSLTNEYKNIEILGHRNPQPEMEQFKKSFFEKYEYREMPLLEVLDNETGIGYGKVTGGKADNLPLLDEMQLPGIVKPLSTEWSALVKFREKIYQQAIAEGAHSISLTDAMLAELRKDMPLTRTAPDSFYLFGNLISDSQEDVDNGNFKFAFQAMGGPSGLKLIGRFCHGNEELTKWVKKAINEEEALHKDVIFAEIAHLPEARVGNVLMRPHFREFEIPYLAGSSLPEEKQIIPDDLMVSISGSGEVILRSKRLNRRVIPRLTNAHNFGIGLPVYRFLCELAYQVDHQYFSWNWNFLSSNIFLPRVEYKHWILCRATWNFEKGLFSKLLGKDVSHVREWHALRQAYRIPRFVQLRQGDSEFLIDGDSSISIQILCDSMRKYGKITLTEFLEGTENTVIGGYKERYVSEILVPLLHKDETEPALQPAEVRTIRHDEVRRNFMAGSEWLYVKIYAGTKTADRLLTSVIKPFADSLLADKMIEKWFFLRFADSDDHIRLRFYNGKQPDFWHIVLTALNTLMDPLIDNGMVQKVQIDTYKRELERYGRHAYEEVESIFFADSQATVSFLDMLSGDEGERYRWLVGLRGVDMLLDDLNFILEDKKKLMDSLQEHFFQEFHGNTQLTVQLNDKYRTHNKDIQSFLNPSDDEKNGIADVIILLEERSSRIRASMTVLLPAMEIPMRNFASSLIHMFLNRLFVSRQRVHELVIYHYLKKYYESKLARNKNKIVKDILEKQ
ncbi:lantibiotic dehydratase [Dyadobacter sediminis]|uniref:Lantibiotic dehydratase n=1 Tax=Dyadobacter sediminis TaxID=1493691 RepID=A0A5R9K6M7_9BACT|nr:lantibiotic dehydratase [Dyadobacter sediminis]TLU89434.1 hypothetical protein FEM55_22090 [Dyadobacter sediminis]GGC05455.1 hypothetical protein GCM10011325_35430 [Dyadobacter sediminis]